MTSWHDRLVRRWDLLVRWAHWNESAFFLICLAGLVAVSLLGF